MKMQSFRAIPLFLVLLFSAFSMSAQNNEAVKINEKLPVSGGEKTDFIFIRTVLLGTLDSVPFDISRSGSYSLGVGYGFPIGKVFEIKIEPRVTWQKLYFRNEAAKWFPSQGSDSSLIYQKIRAFYVEMPLGFKLKFLRNSNDKYKGLFEAGFSFGYNLGSTSKTRRNFDQDGDGDFDTKITQKVHNVPELEKLRYGPYMRMGLNWLSFYVYYRMTPIFDEDEKFGDDINGNGGRAYPKFPGLELGFSIQI